jgi:hypothetical protein
MYKYTLELEQMNWAFIALTRTLLGKCGAKFKILKCSKQTLSPIPQPSTLKHQSIF